MSPRANRSITDKFAHKFKKKRVFFNFFYQLQRNALCSEEGLQPDKWMKKELKSIAPG
jgi:hypothetical protein